MRIAFETYDRLPLPIIQSDLLELRNSAVSGRGVFAGKDLPDGSNLRLEADAALQSPADARNGTKNLESRVTGRSSSDDRQAFEPLSPTAHVIFRAYRKEVCGECFRYDRGREWKLKLPVENGGGLVFCSEDCRTEWTARYGTVGVEAFDRLETVTRKLKRRQVDVCLKPSSEAGTTDSSRTDSLSLIQQKWEETRQTGQNIIVARTKQKLSKAEKTIVRQSSEPDDMDLDAPYYLLTGVLSAFVSAEAQNALVHQAEADHTSGSTSVTTSANVNNDEASSRRASTTPNTQQDETDPCDPSFGVETLLPSLLTLAPDPSCYSHPASSLSAFTKAYLLLLTLLPSTLLRFLTPQLAHELNSRASHNAFSIRPSGLTDGEQSGEFMGWGVWPSASFFNHSCRSNVNKIRVGRQWHFTSGSSTATASTNLNVVQMGMELCITYLGGDEQDLNLTQRRKRLLEGWGFHCNCPRCIEEEKDEKEPRREVQVTQEH